MPRQTDESTWRIAFHIYFRCARLLPLPSGLSIEIDSPSHLSLIAICTQPNANRIIRRRYVLIAMIRFRKIACQINAIFSHRLRGRWTDEIESIEAEAMKRYLLPSNKLQYQWIIHLSEFYLSNDEFLRNVWVSWVWKLSDLYFGGHKVW